MKRSIINLNNSLIFRDTYQTFIVIYVVHSVYYVCIICVRTSYLTGDENDQ
jgi:hypothetical protein